MSAQNLKNTLASLKEKNRYRTLKDACGVDLTSNDYLGMAAHPQLREIAIKSLQGGIDIGAGGSRLLRGNTPQHTQLEEFSAHHFSAPKTLYFATGFQANYAIFAALPSRHDVVLYDSLIHASVRDGINGCNAKSYKFAHNDLGALEDALKKHTGKAQNIWIAIETIYSMDGDFAPLGDMLDLTKQYGATLIADEAHATGIFGNIGKGCTWEHVQRNGYKNLISLHTCGKAIGVSGGLICASSHIIDYLINTARPFIYSTAPMPLQALLVQKSLEILASPDGDIRRTKLSKLCKQGKELFGGHGTHIVPIILGSDERAINIAAALQGEGLDIRAIRPPTVPKGTARLRLSLSSTLNESILLKAHNALQKFTLEKAS